MTTKQHIATRYKVTWEYDRQTQQEIFEAKSIKHEDAQKAEKKARLFALNKVEELMQGHWREGPFVHVTEEYIHGEIIQTYDPKVAAGILSPTRTYGVSSEDGAKI